MFYRVLIAIVILTGVSVGAWAADDESELNFLGSATMAYKDITFEIPAGGISFAPNLMMYNMGGTLSYGNFFTTVNYDQTIKDDAQYAPGNSSLIIMNREDMDISFGYYVGKGFSAFVGYKDGKLSADVTGETTGQQIDVDPGPGVTLVNITVPTDPYQVEFRDKGPFVGISYTAALKNSSLIFNLAYADMKGHVVFGNNGGSSTDGDTTGFSYSVAWNIPVSESTTFTPKINLVRYDFNDTKMGTQSGGGGSQDLSFTQKFDVISFTLAHYF